LNIFFIIKISVIVGIIRKCKFKKVNVSVININDFILNPM